jgi:perosamine synthetase
MEQLDEHIAAKRRIAHRYREAFEHVPGITPMPEADWATSIFWMYTVLVDEQAYGMDSRALLHRLEAAGVQSRPLWQPIHLSPAHAGQTDACPVAEDLYRRALSLPCSVGLTEAQQAKVIEQIAARP